RPSALARVSRLQAICHSLPLLHVRFVSFHSLFTTYLSAASVPERGRCQPRRLSGLPARPAPSTPPMVHADISCPADVTTRVDWRHGLSNQGGTHGWDTVSSHHDGTVMTSENELDLAAGIALDTLADGAML